MVITVYKDGSWTVWSAGDGHYAAAGDPDWLVNIPIADARAYPQGRQRAAG